MRTAGFELAAERVGRADFVHVRRLALASSASILRARDIAKTEQSEILLRLRGPFGRERRTLYGEMSISALVLP